MTTILTIILSVAGGILYRMGGSSRFHTLWRDIGTSLCAVLLMFIFGIKDWTLVASFVLLFAAMTTYLDFVNKWFGHTDREYWLNWMLIGFTYNIAMLPTVWIEGLWLGFCIRMLALPFLFVVSDYLVELYDTEVSLLEDEAIQKEFLRGLFTVCTVPILFI